MLINKLTKIKNNPFEVEGIVRPFNKKKMFFWNPKFVSRNPQLKVFGGDGDDEWRPTIEVSEKNGTNSNTSKALKSLCKQ